MQVSAQYTNLKEAQASPLACTVKNIIGHGYLGTHIINMNEFQLLKVEGTKKRGYFCRYKDSEYASTYSAARWSLVFRQCKCSRHPLDRPHMAPLLSIKMTAAVVTHKCIQQVRAIKSLSEATAAAAAWAMRSWGTSAAQMGRPE